VFTRHVSPQIAAALLGQPRPLLTERQAHTVDVLKAQSGFTTMRRLVLSFRTILRVCKVATLHRWLTRAHATNIPALQRFVRTLRRDLGAVEGERARRGTGESTEDDQAPDVRPRRCGTPPRPTDSALAVKSFVLQRERVRTISGTGLRTHHRRNAAAAVERRQQRVQEFNV
jgi:hypothetical protein